MKYVRAVSPTGTYVMYHYASTQDATRPACGSEVQTEPVDTEQVEQWITETQGVDVCLRCRTGL